MDREFVDRYSSYEPRPLDFDFFEALESGYEPHIRAAVAAGEDLENIVYGGALNVVAWRGWSKELCHFLIDNGAKYNAVCQRSGRTPLHGFARQGWCDFIEQSIIEGCPINQLDTRSCKTALGLARCSGHAAAVELLLRHGADPCVAMDDKHTTIAREIPEFLKPKPKT